jgi:hypothetical protein
MAAVQQQQRPADAHAPSAADDRAAAEGGPVTTRRDLAIPAGWKPARLAQVKCLPLEVKGARAGITGRKPDPWQPQGVWRVVDRSPDVRGANSWWLAPIDAAARTWATRNHGDMLQGHVSVPGRLLVPASVQLDGVAS